MPRCILYLQRTAHGGKVVGQTFGVAPDRPGRFDVLVMAPVLEAIYERLFGVVIENLNWQEVVRRYDRPGALFYLDPPYWSNETDYGVGLFGRDQFALMAETFRTMQGRAVLSINDTPDVRQVLMALKCGKRG